MDHPETTSIDLDIETSQGKRGSLADALPTGVSVSDVVDAVQRSGYPLQIRVADVARRAFPSLVATVFEEWSYLDRDEHRRREIDLRCEVALPGQRDLRVRPVLDLLIECKQSELPWVFFTHERRETATALPRVAGLRIDEVAVTDDTSDVHLLPVPLTLGLAAEPFVLDPPLAGTFSRYRRKGNKNLELSGSEAWSSLTEPLLKAASHLYEVAKPWPPWRAYDARLIVPVAVLDAPLLISAEGPEGTQLTPVSWVRVERHESLTGQDFYQRPRLSCFDVVHVDHLNSYLSDVRTFAEAFATAVLRHQDVLAKGRGHQPDLGSTGFAPDRLQPVRAFDRDIRARVLAADLGRWIGEQVVPYLRRPRPLAERWPGRFWGDIPSPGKTGRPSEPS